MKKKVISFIVALALAVPTAMGAFPRFMEGAADNTEDGGSVYPVKVDEESFPDENFRNYIIKLISEFEDEEVTEETAGEEPEEETEPQEVTEETTEEEPEEAAQTVIITGPAEGQITVPITVSNEIIAPVTTEEEKGEPDRDYWLTWKIASQITEINVSGMEIQSLVGIEYFFALETLLCSDNEISELNLSDNKELVTLDCSDNGISELDLSNNSKLEVLDCSFNQIAELNLADKKELAELYCSHNEISELNLSNNDKLAALDCSYNEISELNLNNNHKLVALDCCNNNISELNLSQNTELEALCCSNNPITPKLDLCNNTSLRNLKCSDTNIIALYLGDRNDVPFDTFEVLNNGITIKTCSPDFDITELPDYGERFTSENFNGNSENGNPEFEGTSLINIKDGTTYTYDYDTQYRYVGRARAIGDDGIVTFYITFSITSDEGHKLEKVENDFVCSNVDGLWLWKCSKCGKYFTDETGETEAIVRDAHSADGYECNYCQHWQICDNCGREFDRENHKIDPVTNACIICGEVFDHLHDLDADFVDEIPPTCTEDGMLAHYYCAERRIYYYQYPDGHIAEISREELIIEALGHDYAAEYDEENHWQECTRCGDKDFVLKHVFDEEGVVVKPETCVQDGLTKYFCLDCDYVKEEVIPATGAHSFTDKFKDLPELDQHVRLCDVCGTEEDTPFDHDDDINIITPTCFEKGKMIYTCKDCGRVKVEEVGEPTGEHDLSEYKHNANEHWRICENNGCPYEEEHEEHKWDEGVITVEPTVDHKGKIVFTCTVCQYERTEWINQIEKPTEPEITQPEVTQPEITQPEITRPEATQPEPTRPTQPTQPSQTTQPEATTVTEPTVTKPSVTEPTGTNPPVTKPTENRPASTDSASVIGVESAETTSTGSKPAAAETTSKEPDVVINTSAAATDEAPTASSDNNVIGIVDGTGDGNKDDNNISTGLAISVIPAAVSGAMVVLTKKRNKRK